MANLSLWLLEYELFTFLSDKFPSCNFTFMFLPQRLHELFVILSDFGANSSRHQDFGYMLLNG